MKNSDMPAMPCELPITPAQRQEAAALQTSPLPTAASGLTKREHFAAMAMASLIIAYPEATRSEISSMARDQANDQLDCLEAENA